MGQLHESERCTAKRCPLGWLATAAQGLDQLPDRRLEGATLLARHPRELAGEARTQLIGGTHRECLLRGGRVEAL